MSIDSESKKSWYLVYCKQRQESIAQENLQRQHYETYLPFIKTLKRKRGQGLVEHTEPLFPRYLFIKLGEGIDDWAPIRSTIGVSGLVRFGHITAKVPDSLLAAVRASCDDEGFYNYLPQQLQNGESVRIIEGLFAGYEAIFLAPTGRERAEIMLNTVCESQTRLEVPQAYLERISL